MDTGSGSSRFLLTVVSLLLLYFAIWPETAVGQSIDCYECKANITDASDVTPKCDRKNISCNTSNYFCGVVVQRLDVGQVRYWEKCVPFAVCRNTTTGCPQDTCFAHCCQKKDFCNHFNRVTDNVASIIAEILHRSLPKPTSITVPASTPSSSSSSSTPSSSNSSSTPMPGTALSTRKNSYLFMCQIFLILMVILPAFY